MSEKSELQDDYDTIIQMEHNHVVRMANSMHVFADGEPTFVYGQWRAWSRACEAEGRQIPPSEFKSWPKERREKY